MKFTFLLKPFIFYFTLSFISCNKPPCKCDFNPVNFLEFKIINQQGQNLLFGSNAFYNIDSLQILKQPSDFIINNASVANSINDSTAIRLDFYVQETKNYIHYNNQTSEDSIEIKWQSKIGRCCGAAQSYKDIDSVKFNNELISPVKGIYHFIK